MLIAGYRGEMVRTLQRKATATPKKISYLELLVKYRLAIQEKESQIENIMPDAIVEAFEQLGGDNVVFRSKGAKIVLQQKKQYQTVRDNITLERIDADIKAEERGLAEENRETLGEIDLEIHLLKQKIQALEEAKKKLLTNDRIIILKAKFKTVYESTMYLSPTLAVHIGK
ncbi:MAG: hypothetical protein VKL42_12530 [Snowella sp.]|nr:hypothetical protein [Snowella sp.]